MIIFQKTIIILFRLFYYNIAMIFAFFSFLSLFFKFIKINNKFQSI